jgi:hypothetical protein
MDMSNRNNQIIVGIIVLIILVLLGWWLFAKKSAQVGGEYGNATSTETTSGITETPTTSGEETGNTTVGTQTSGNTETQSPSTSTSGDSVTVNNQSAGSKVTVASVSFAKAGWVAIRDEKGLRVLGAAWFPAGSHSDVTVSLLKNTVTGQKYQAVLFADNGNKTFELHTDTLLSGAETSFTAQ